MKRKVSKTTRPSKRLAGKKTTAKKAAAPRKSAAKKPAPRADFGAPIGGFFARQPAHLRTVLEELRKLVEEAAPDADSSIKWGMPFYSVNGTMMCALGAHKSHVNLILAGPPRAYADPQGRLSGESKLGRHLKLTTIDELPRDAVRKWLRTAVELARKK